MEIWPLSVSSVVIGNSIFVDVIYSMCFVIAFGMFTLIAKDRPEIVKALVRGLCWPARATLQVYRLVRRNMFQGGE